MRVPENAIVLAKEVYKTIFPIVREELFYWKRRAQEIPNEELRRQALQSINGKAFHCEGGAILALIAGPRYQDVVKFIVRYQTICDYLDNLCDRSNSLDPEDFASLHQSLRDALDISGFKGNYYKYRKDRDDGGYLYELVCSCRSFLENFPNYPDVREPMLELCRYYCEMQVHKHVKREERINRLKAWFEGYQSEAPGMTWYEFSASCGSTLGIFSLVAHGARADFRPKLAEIIKTCYFPYIQGFHILLDYFIDQEEDRKEGDLNFCCYYPHPQKLFQRFCLFFKEAEGKAKDLPHPNFHRLVLRGLLGVYLSDQKVRCQKDLKKMAQDLLKLGGTTSLFFYVNGKGYRLWKAILQKEGKNSF